MRKLIFLLLVVLCASFVLGLEEKHMKILAVQEANGEYHGSVADLYLELKPGSGRVFLETFPLTKMDTQISTRFAKEIACNYFDLDCNKYDFIYTIRASSNIVGGPSAGAAMAALTAITVLNLEDDEKVTITGTINSGGTIGPVGGMVDKIEAAKSNGLEKVLIFRGGSSFEEENETVDLMELAEGLKINVVEVGDLNEVVFELTGSRLKADEYELVINEDYQEVMKEVAGLLCGRRAELEKKLTDLNESEVEEITARKNSSMVAWEDEDYYSAASFCFGLNIWMKNRIYEQGEFDLLEKWREIDREKLLVEERLKKEKIETISDLQTLMIVKERLSEVEEARAIFGESENPEYTLAFAEERLFSAVSWMYFFKMEGKEFVMDAERLKLGCQQKIAESQERYQYAELILGIPIEHTQKKINEAIDALNAEEYGLCLIKAAQAKAEANTIWSSLGLREENLNDSLAGKFKAVEKVIAENSAEGIFPIMGYSYYQYANSLRDEEKQTALLYLEYALEMSDLDIYFEEEAQILGFKLGEEQRILERYSNWVRFIGGFTMGFLVALLLVVLIKIASGKKIKKKAVKRKKGQAKKRY